MTARKEFSRATKRLAWERCGGRCEGVLPAPSNEFCTFDVILYCSAPLQPGRFEYDHVNNVWTSDDNSLENCAVLCSDCHKEKTKRDVKQIAKSKRIQDKAIGALTSKRPMPFGRKSAFKRKFSGEIVRR